MTFKKKLINVNKSKRRIKRDAGGRSKNPTTQLLAKYSRIQLDKSKVKPSGKTYIRFTRKKDWRWKKEVPSIT